MGMPFVLQSSGNWIKNKGSDFYVAFAIQPKKVRKVIFLLYCNVVYVLFLFHTFSFSQFATLMTERSFLLKDTEGGKGTAKSLLDKIAELESEAEKSFMHRSVILNDFLLTELSLPNYEISFCTFLWCPFKILQLCFT